MTAPSRRVVLLSETRVPHPARTLSGFRVGYPAVSFRQSGEGESDAALGSGEKIGHAVGLGVVLIGEVHRYCASNDLLDHLRSLPQLPDGIFCTNDLLALSVIDILKEHLSPQQLSTIKIAGFDDIPQAAWLSYQLTTVSQPTRHQAEAAVKLLLRRIEQPDAPEHTEVTEVSLIRRKTL